MARAKTTNRSSRVLTDHDEIRTWVEERGGCPAQVKSTSGNGDPGIVRIDFPGYSGVTTLRRISWDRFFRKFDESNLALVVEDTTSRGQRSNFNKLVGRDTLESGTSRRSRTRAGTRSPPGTRSRSSAGGTRSRKTTRTGTARRTSQKRTGTGRSSTGSRTGARSTRARSGERRAGASSSARRSTTRSASKRRSNRPSSRSTRRGSRSSKK